MLIDTSRFPLVYLREPEAQAPADAGNGNDASAEAQIESLLDQGRHFVLLTDHLPGDHPEESHEERKQRALFFKRNRERMRQLCRGMVVITGDRAVPAALRWPCRAWARRWACGLRSCRGRMRRRRARGSCWPAPEQAPVPSARTWPGARRTLRR